MVLAFCLLILDHNSYSLLLCRDDSVRRSFVYVPWWPLRKSQCLNLFVTHVPEEKQYYSAHHTIFVLPAEIRLKIYEQVYKGVVVGILSFRRNVPKRHGALLVTATSTSFAMSPILRATSPHRTINPRWHPSLLHTCSTTRTESAPLSSLEFFSSSRPPNDPFNSQRYCA